MKITTNAKLAIGIAALAAVAVLAGCGSSGGRGKSYTQFDRLARPAVNEVFATVANNRHQINDQDRPIDDPSNLKTDITNFMTNTAGRSAATTNVAATVLVPDVMTFDVTQTGAAYLGVETGGATGGKFGGRALTDDVVDTSLGVIFGNTVSALGLAPDDGKEIAGLTTDNVDATTAPKHFTATFPYVGAPQ